MFNNLFWLNEASVLSSAILSDGKKHLAYAVANNNSYWKYNSLAIGNNTNISAASNNTGLYGNLTFSKVCNGSYESTNKAVWQANFSYGNLSYISEAVICRNNSLIRDNSLARIVFDTVTLNISDLLQVTMKVQF